MFDDLFKSFKKKKENEEVVVQKQELAIPPIHTMQKDLDEILNPNKDKEIIDELKKSKGETSGDKPKKAKKSPFLDFSKTENKKENKLPQDNPFFNYSPLQDSKTAIENVVDSKDIQTFSVDSLEDQIAENMPASALSDAIDTSSFSIPEKPEKKTWFSRFFGSKKAKKIENAEQFIKDEKDNTDYAMTVSENINIVDFEKKKKIMMAFIALVITLFIAAFGFYLWKATRVSLAPENNITPINIPSPKPTTPVLPKFETDKPNYFSMDLDSLDSLAIKKLIKEKSEDVIKSQIQTPIEFIITDKDNNPVKLSIFSSKLGIKFPESITSRLSEDFSLFLFNDNSGPGLGIVFNITSGEEKFFSDIMKEEPNLIKYVEPIFIVDFSLSENGENNKKFSDGEPYKEIKIRYFNIISPLKLSIDYTVISSKFIIGTTKMTIRKIYDYTVQFPRKSIDFTEKDNSKEETLNENPAE